MDDTDLTPLPADRAAALRDTARTVIRGWLSLPDPVRAAEEVSAIGAQAIAAAADAARRLLVTTPAAADAGAVLDSLRRLAESAQPVPPRGWSPFRRAAPLPVDIDAELAALVRGLEESRDRLIQDVIRIDGERDRIATTDARLEEAAHLLRTLATGAEAAAREIAGTDPARAAALRGAVTTRLTERLGDVLTQLAVTRQGRLALAIVRDGHETLATAVDRARLTMVAALRTATLAQRAVADGVRLGEQAAALDRAAAAGAAAGPDRQAAVRRALDDAIAQVGAAAAATRGSALDLPRRDG